MKEFLDSLKPKHAKKVTWTLQLIEDMDQVPVQYFKKLRNSDDIWEVRARIGSHSFRLLGFITGDEFIVLTNGFKKNHKKHRSKK